MINVCFPQNAITHPSNDNKTSVDFTWSAPTDYTGDIIFRFVEC